MYKRHATNVLVLFWKMEKLLQVSLKTFKKTSMELKNVQCSISNIQNCCSVNREYSQKVKCLHKRGGCSHIGISMEERIEIFCTLWT